MSQFLNELKTATKIAEPTILDRASDRSSKGGFESGNLEIELQPSDEDMSQWLGTMQFMAQIPQLQLHEVVTNHKDTKAGSNDTLLPKNVSLDLNQKMVTHNASLGSDSGKTGPKLVANLEESQSRPSQLDISELVLQSGKDNIDLRDALKKLNRLSSEKSMLDPRMVDHRETAVIAGSENKSNSETNRNSVQPSYLQFSSTEDVMRLRSNPDGEDTVLSESVQFYSENSAGEQPLQQSMSMHRNTTNTVEAKLSTTGLLNQGGKVPSEVVDVKGQWDLATAIRGLAIRGGGSVKMTMNPASLGKVTLTVTEVIDDSAKTLDVKLVTESNEAKNAIDSEIKQLENALRSQYGKTNIHTSVGTQSEVNHFSDQQRMQDKQSLELMSGDSWIRNYEMTNEKLTKNQSDGSSQQRDGADYRQQEKHEHLDYNSARGRRDRQKMWDDYEQRAFA
jgi:hypothetical protein